MVTVRELVEALLAVEDQDTEVVATDLHVLEAEDREVLGVNAFRLQGEPHVYIQLGRPTDDAVVERTADVGLREPQGYIESEPI